MKIFSPNPESCQFVFQAASAHVRTHAHTVTATSCLALLKTFLFLNHLLASRTSSLEPFPNLNQRNCETVLKSAGKKKKGFCAAHTSITPRDLAIMKSKMPVIMSLHLAGWGVRERAMHHSLYACRIMVMKAEGSGQGWYA